MSFYTYPDLRLLLKISGFELIEEYGSFQLAPHLHAAGDDPSCARCLIPSPLKERSQPAVTISEKSAIPEKLFTIEASSNSRLVRIS